MIDQVPLNPQQIEAIEHGGGPMMILAGAGTGKTRVLVHRIARIVESGVDPWAILAVTFTNKAAQEMRHRLQHLLGDVAQRMQIGTFHATCARLLRRFGEGVGLPRSFAIFDDDDQVKLIERLIREARIGDQISARSILGRIDRAKNRGEDPLRPTGSFDEAIGQIYPRYQERLAKEGAVDFNDLILKTIDLLDRPSWAPLLRSKFRWVLVDEFQDTNRVQYDLVRRLSEETRNLTVVGDDDQSIYAWRGAEPRNLLDFDRDFPDARIVKLEQNYRSTQVILDAANAIISENPDRHDKSLWTLRSGGDPIEVWTADDERGEAGAISRSIRQILQGGRSPGDVAILFRTNAQSRVLEEHLMALRVPARVVGTISFFERREIRDLIAYLRLISNRGANSALERVINVPARGIGDATVERLRAQALAQETSLFEAARLGGRDGIAGIGRAPSRKLREFVQMIEDLGAGIERGASVAETIARVVERSGIRAKLEAQRDDESRDRLGNLAELVIAAADMEDEARSAGPAGSGSGGEGEENQDEGRSPSTIDQFLERIALSSPGDRGVGRARADDLAPRVSLMTIHVAKGLEWPIVFVAGMEDGLFPSLREREGTSEDSALEEERRLAYVAITRARDRLVLCRARTRRIWGEIRIQPPSRFLGDLPPGTTEGISVDRIARASDPVDREAPGRDLAIGDAVAHASLGDGRVASISGSGDDLRALVDFDRAGQKTVLVGFLKRLP